MRDVINGWTWLNLLVPAFAGFVADACTCSLTKWPETPIMVRLAPRD